MGDLTELTRFESRNDQYDHEERIGKSEFLEKVLDDAGTTPDGDYECLICGTVQYVEPMPRRGRR